MLFVSKPGECLPFTTRQNHWYGQFFVHSFNKHLILLRSKEANRITLQKKDSANPGNDLISKTNEGKEGE